MSRAVIVCGAEIKDYDFVKSYLRVDDFYICCDSGLSHIKKLGISNPDLIIGDFDSHDKPDDNEYPAGEIIVLPREKDDTDSAYAVKEAVKRGFDEVLLVGAIGGRLDHGLVNVYALIGLYEKDINAEIVDDYSVMGILGPASVGTVNDQWAYFSLLAISGKVEGVTIKNAKYELKNASIAPSYQFATSNEPIQGKMVEITVGEGYLLLIKDRI
ncbi:MAG: thiamine diphosphokinase [Lachnospiraceae bacterium]|nr:thiamine diphosphokinase [Lachnospiraceae bacterium]